MKRHATSASIVLAAILVLTTAPAAEALQWTVMAAHSTILIPGPEPEDGYIKANGFHATTITQISVQDLVFPIRFKVDLGRLLQSGSTAGACSTGWTWANNALSTVCTTIDTVYPCENSWWQASTVGVLQFHPQGGIKQTFSPPTWIDCSCV